MKISEEMSEKLKLLTGKDFWTTYENEGLGIKKIVVSDGPTGLRYQEAEGDNLGMGDSKAATCFPTSSAMASSWDVSLVGQVAAGIAAEAYAEGVDIVLGPGVNIKRSPLCGRNFEYYSEDPFLAGELGSAFVEGLQKNGIGASLKHFAANNQEAFRMSVDTLMDERTLREIYLKAFERIVKKSAPWTVMSAYNKLNGSYCTENGRLLNDILREEWGFDGLVVSDWGAVNDITQSINNGLDLEMPSNGGLSHRLLIEAAEKGLLKETAVERAVENLARLSARCANTAKRSLAGITPGENHELARRAAAESMVLLKNERKALPLMLSDKVLFVGDLMNNPVIQGNGSSRVHASKVDSISDELSAAGFEFGFEQGYLMNVSEAGEENDKLIAEAVGKAAEYDAVVVFAGLFSDSNAEGYDRTDMELPAGQNRLIEALADSRRCKRMIVILQTGAPVTMPWVDKADSILQMNLCGQGAGKALADILSGKVSPSGKLAETYPIKLAHTPAWLFRGDSSSVTYNESIFAGYRYYDKKELEVLFPFGHGLSYTSFEYSDLESSWTEGSAGTVLPLPSLQISCKIRNTGACSGREVVQAYIGLNEDEVIQPVRKLAAFEKLELQPGEVKSVKLVIPAEEFRYYSEWRKEWVYATGTSRIEIGSSSRDIRLSGETVLSVSNRKYRLIDANTPVGVIMAIPELMETAGEKAEEFTRSMGFGSEDVTNAAELEASMYYMPLRNMVQMTGGEFSFGDLDAFIGQLNDILEKEGLLLATSKTACNYDNISEENLKSGDI
ncbi:MAG: glycosyl hydrolase [Clostridiales bacterium]|nr:glycosyl hydrolase [Clostridiales bacterium]